MNAIRRFLPLLAALLATAGVGLALPAQAVHPLTVLEDGLELSAGDTRWPDAVGGTFVITSCPGCAKTQFSVARDAVFTVGKKEVGYADFLVAVRGGRNRALFVHISRASGEVAHARVIP